MSDHDEKPVDRELFVRLLVRHDRSIRAFLRSLLPTANDVDEAMQEVSVVAWRKFSELDDPENFRPWLCVIARYEVLMHRRRKARDRFVLDQGLEELITAEGSAELAIRDQQLLALESCLDKLPVTQRDLVLRIYSAELPINVIADNIGKTPDALYKTISRLRQKLLQCVERTLIEAGES